MEGEEDLKTGTAGMIDLRRKNRDQEPDVQNLTGLVHQLPCCIKYDGPCDVSHYFKPKPTGVVVDGLIVDEAYFRGRKLQGTTLPLPPAYSGFLLGKKSFKNKRKAPGSDEQSSNCWEVNATFENIAYWNHDSLPSKDDAFVRSFHWLSVAEALHKPVLPEDLASAGTTLEKNS